MNNNQQDHQCYRLFIDLQKDIYASQKKTAEQLDHIRESLESKLIPLESKVSKHDHIFEISGKILSWLLPSGVLLSFLSFVVHASAK